MKQYIYLTLLFAFTLLAYSCKDGENGNSGETPEPKTLSDSIQMLSDKIRENPHDAALFVQRSNLQFLNGDLDEAINDMEIAMKVDSTKPPYYSKLASLYMLKANGSEKAKEVLNKCINRYPSYPQAHIDLAKIFLYVGMFQEAMQEIQFLELNNLQNGDSYFVRGIILRKASETESDTANTRKWRQDALAAFKKSVEYDDENWEAYNLIGVSLTELGDSIALEYFKTATSKFPDNQEIKYWNGWSLRNFGHYEEAKDTYIEAAQMDSASYWTFMAYSDLGDMYKDISLESDRYSTAINYYSNALACDTTAFETYAKRGDAYAQNKQYQLAEADYRKALKLETNYEPAIEGLNRIAGKR
ncbi:MAG: tetratricopeptide repeat protein [Bacteroidales bacterium]|nr:tetratricopeptide repeat protein [Bacteroidales bacterium]